ncbi:MAG: epoxide hydrolase N-terminal domain-containing protein [Acetobacteraceae bacterium]
MAAATTASTAPRADASIRPFHIGIPDEALVDLHRRVAATQWPERETVTGPSQGVQLATMQKLAQYWATQHDWRRCEARLNALPLIVTHGWPGSVIACVGYVGRTPVGGSGFGGEAMAGHRWDHQVERVPCVPPNAVGLVSGSDPPDEEPRLYEGRGARRRLGARSSTGSPWAATSPRGNSRHF